MEAKIHYAHKTVNLFNFLSVQHLNCEASAVCALKQPFQFLTAESSSLNEKY